MTPTKDDALADYILDPALPDYLRDIAILKTYGNEIERLDRIENFIKRVREKALTLPREDADKTKAWFETPNPNLGGVKPIDDNDARNRKRIREALRESAKFGCTPHVIIMIRQTGTEDQAVEKILSAIKI